MVVMEGVDVVIWIDAEACSVLLLDRLRDSAGRDALRVSSADISVITNAQSAQQCGLSRGTCGQRVAQVACVAHQRRSGQRPQCKAGDRVCTDT